jgi:hypothetical protein
MSSFVICTFAKYNYNNQVEEGEMDGPCNKNRGEEKKIIGGKARGKEPLERPRRRWLVNIRMDLGEVGWGDENWIGLTQDRNRWRDLVNSVLNLRVP